MPEADDELHAAVRRLDAALTRLEGRMTARLVAGGAPLTATDRGATGRLEAELETERARGRALETAAADASAALGRAAAEVRAALTAGEG